MKLVASLTVALSMYAVAPSVLAADPTCGQIKRRYEGKTYFAHVPLYDTVVGRDGIIELERDNEEIPAGSESRVKDIECGGKKVEVTLKQVVGQREINKVEIYFRIRQEDREAAEGMAEFERMWSYVLAEDPPEQEPARE